jgi:hypothetical protein
VKVASAPDLSRAVEVAFTEDHSKQFSNQYYALPLGLTYWPTDYSGTTADGQSLTANR